MSVCISRLSRETYRIHKLHSNNNTSNRIFKNVKMERIDVICINFILSLFFFMFFYFFIFSNNLINFVYNPSSSNSHPNILFTSIQKNEISTTSSVKFIENSSFSLSID